MEQLKIGDWVEVEIQDNSSCGTRSRLILEKVLFVSPEYISTDSYQRYTGDVKRVGNDRIANSLLRKATNIIEKWINHDETNDESEVVALIKESREWRNKV